MDLSKTFLRQWLLVMAFLLLMCVAVGYDLFSTYQRTGKVEKDRLMVQARVIDINLSKQLVSTHDSIDNILSDLKSFRSGNTYQPAINRRLSVIEKAITGIRTLVIMDKNGVVHASNRKELIGRDFSYRDYFKLARMNNSSEAIYLSPPFKTALNVYVMNLTHAIQDSRGEFDGIIAVSLDPEYFKTLMDSVLYAPDMWVQIVHWDGKLFMMSPDQEGLPGKDQTAPGSFFSRHRESNRDENIMTGMGHASGESRIMALKTVSRPDSHLDKGMVVGVCRSTRAVFAEWRRDMAIRVGGLSVTAIIMIFFLVIYQKNVRRANEQARKSLDALEESEQKYRSIFENVQDVIYRADASGTLVDISPSIEQYSGYTREELIGKDTAFFYADPNDRTVMLAEMMKTGAVINHEIVMKGKDGRIVIASLNAHFRYDREGKITGVEGVLRDITKRKQMEEMLQALAFIDGLTHIANRRRFDEAIEQEFRRAKRENGHLTVIMMDIDNFKSYNDNYGHGSGDYCLKMVATTLNDCITRAGDLLARYGGEEFVALLPNTDTEGALHMAERFRKKLADMRLRHGHSSTSPYVTISAGCFTMNPGDDKFTDVGMLIAEADKMLYKAKQAGRNRSMNS